MFVVGVIRAGYGMGPADFSGRDNVGLLRQGEAAAGRENPTPVTAFEWALRARSEASHSVRAMGLSANTCLPDANAWVGTDRWSRQ